ncbi:MAG: 1-(5-phosphoribosyl)-5-[(5-phosphoribosylamino)methylideneamino]imidazole-4-carboxamide isomerase [Anaerovorax sp.]
MIILPAIDIKDGQCVRLTKGDFGTVEKVAEDPVETGIFFQKSGAQWIHMVDLDGAVGGVPVNSEIFLQVAKATGLKVEVGGGIRTMETIEYYLKNNIERVILGSVAIENPTLVREAVGKYGAHIAVGIDAKNGMVSGGGWLTDSQVNYLDLAKKMEEAGVQTIIYTDISKDGTLSGPNLEQLSLLSKTVNCDLIASGGIHVVEDIEALYKMNLYGTICGKSIYKGTLSLEAAIKAGKGGCSC